MLRHTTGCAITTWICIMAVLTSQAQSKPAFTTNAVTSVATGTTYNYKFDAQDSLQSQLSFYAAGLPAWLSFEKSNHALQGKAGKAGQYRIDIVAYNNTDSAHQRFMLTVSDKQTLKILCLGNSITNGTGSYNSYRRSLWKLLRENRYNFDFIGSWDKHHMGGEVPDPDFDMDHEGHSGWRFDDFFTPPSWDSARGNLAKWLQLYKPDIILLELGTNDIFQCRNTRDIIGDLQTMITVFRKRNEKMVILLAQIPPLGKAWADKKLCGDSTSYDEAIRNLNNALMNFAKTNTSAESVIEIVDQYTGMNPSVAMYDDIHPNEIGEAEMATRWYRTLRKYLHKLQ